MTILTKPSNEKKLEKAPLELGTGGQDEVAMLHGGGAGGVPRRTLLGLQLPYTRDAESVEFNRPHLPCIKTVLLCLISVVVMMMGMLGGYALYRMYGPNNSQNAYYRALCDIPYMSNNNLTYPRVFAHDDEFDLNWSSLFPRFGGGGDDAFSNEGMATRDLMDDNFFREEIQLDLSDAQSYSKIDVPNFKDGRKGRFMHDFKENQSAIIDTTANRCFIMSLDRETTLPPKSFMDLMQKMGSGYYNVDTDRVRRTMRVVTPPITDLSLISERIANECYDMKVYMLENYVSGVFKREAKPITDAGKFAEFSGKGIIEFDLMNIADIETFESKTQE